MGGPPQPNYLNAAISLDWNGDPLLLLSELQAIEHALGRVREVVNGPRTIDLDVLWIQGQWLDDPSLTVPHPRLRERSFALLPLLDVAPDAIDPRSGDRYAEVAKALPDADGVRVSSA